jgi:hypothetical protein
MFSALPPTTDIAQHRRHVGKVSLAIDAPEQTAALFDHLVAPR